MRIVRLRFSPAAMPGACDGTIASWRRQRQILVMNIWCSASVRRLVLALMVLAGGTPRHVLAAQLDGVSFPATQTVGNATLALNGVGLRTFSVFAINVYVAGLYLQRPSHDANAILASGGNKMLLLHFVHDVSAEKVRDTWRTGLLRNCPAPCEISQGKLSAFLNALPAMRAGETVELVFTPDGMQAYYDQKPAGEIPDPEFARLMLAVFIGPNTTVPQLRQELLGLQSSATVATN